MSYLLKMADSNYNTAKLIFQSSKNDELYLNHVCYNLQQAFEKLLKYAIEMQGERYGFSHDITKLGIQSNELGYALPKKLEAFAGNLTIWESSSRYNYDFCVTLNQIKIAFTLYLEVRTCVLAKLNADGADICEEDKNSNNCKECDVFNIGE